MAPVTTMMNTALTSRNTSITSMTNTITVIFILAAAFCIDSMCYGLYVHKVPFSKYILTSLNPLVLLFMWPLHLLNFVYWGISKVRGKQTKVHDAEMQQKPQRSAIMQSNRLDRDLAEAFDIEQTPNPSPTYPVWNRPAYVPVTHLSSSSSSLEIQAARHVYVPLSHFTSSEAYTYNDRRSSSPLSAYNFPTYSPYAASERHVVGGENAAYLEAGLSNSQLMKAAFVNKKEVERIRMAVDNIEAERVRKEADEGFVGSNSTSATETTGAQKTSIEDLSRTHPLDPFIERLFPVGPGRSEFVHPVSRPASVKGFISQCSDSDSSDGEDEETLERTQAEADTTQRFQHHARVQELKEARYQADIEAALADLRKQLESQTKTASESVGTESETLVTASPNSSSSSEFPFRSGSAPTFAAALKSWEAEEIKEEKQTSLDPILASVVEMFNVLPVQRPKGWKGASLVPAESLLKIMTDFDFGSGTGIDPGPYGFGTLVYSPKHYVPGEEEAPERIQAEAEGAQQCQSIVDLESFAEVLIDAEVDVAPVDVEAATLERDLDTPSIRYSIVDLFQTAPIQNIRGEGASLDSQESLPGITMDFDVDFGFGPLIASPVISDREDSSPEEDITSLSSASSDVSDAWEAEIKLREFIMDMFANNPIQHLQGHGASVVSASPASSSSFETYPGGASPAPSSSFETYPDGRSNSSPAFADPFGDFSEVCFAARFLPENRDTADEMNKCERAPEEDEAGEEGISGELDMEEAASVETEEIESTPIMRETPEAEDFLTAALPSFRSQPEFPKPKPKPLESMLQHWELRATADCVPDQRFVPDWKFEKDMAR